MTRFAIAGVQEYVPVAGQNLPALTAAVNRLMLVYPWVQMVVLSELAVNGPALVFAEEMPGPTEQAFQALARKHRIWLIPGSAYERTKEGVYNTAAVINPDGEVVLRYRKMFPFTPYGEARPGSQFRVFDVPGVGRFGLSVCYDIWFPETTRTLACMGAEVLIHPSMTPTIDRDVELSIVRATAAMNQLYVFDVNGVGGGGVGRSIVVGPDGDVIHEAGSGAELIPVEIDLARVRQGRERGVLNLGQPLKSFRDAPVRFEVYDPASPLREGLTRLGPLAKPRRWGSK